MFVYANGSIHEGAGNNRDIEVNSLLDYQTQSHINTSSNDRRRGICQRVYMLVILPIHSEYFTSVFIKLPEMVTGLAKGGRV